MLRFIHKGETAMKHLMENTSSLFTIRSDKYPDYVVGINSAGGIGAVKANQNDVSQQWLLRPNGGNSSWQLWNNQLPGTATAATVSSSGDFWVRRWGISTDVAPYQTFTFRPAAGPNAEDLIDKFFLYFNYPDNPTDYLVTVTDTAQHGSWYVTTKTPDPSWQTFTLEAIDPSQTRPDALTIVKQQAPGVFENALNNGQFYNEQVKFFHGNYLQEFVDGGNHPPEDGPVYVVGAAPVLSAQVNVLPDSVYTDEFDQIKKTPWFLAIRERFWSRYNHLGFIQSNAGSGSEPITTTKKLTASVSNSKTHTSEETWGVKFGLEAGVKFGPVTAGASLEITHELKVTQTDVTEENTTKEYSERVTIPPNSVMAGWTLADRYRLYPIEKNGVVGNPVVDVRSAAPSTFGKQTADIEQPGSGSTPARLRPPTSSPLATSSVTFQWSAVSGATGYYLGVGTSQASVADEPWGDIFAGYIEANTSQVVTGIPLTGDPVFVCLWLLNDGDWSSTEYTYQTQEALSTA